MSLQPRRRREALLTEQAAVRLLPSVCSGVHVEVGRAPEPPLAVGAGIRPFSRVDPFVQEQLTRREEGLSALGALVGPLACVCQIVPHEGGRLGETLPTARAHKWTLAGVRVEVFALRTLGLKALGALGATEGPKVAVAALMSAQLSVCEECLLAGDADVWPLTCVDSLVACEAGQLGEALLTVGALERSLTIVGQQVPVKYLKLREALPTLGTRVRPLPGVDLLVLIQEPHMCEAFAALTGKRPLTGVIHLVSLQI